MVLTPTTTGIPDGAVPSKDTVKDWPGKSTYTCTGADATPMPTSSSSGSAGWIMQDENGTIRYPLVNESPATNWNTGSTWDTTTPAYGCRNGDAFVSGTLSGKLDDRAATTTSTRPGTSPTQDPTADVLGLVGNNGVLVWNPMNGARRRCSAQQDRKIDAAMLSPAHTFQVQNYDIGCYPRRRSRSSGRSRRSSAARSRPRRSASPPGTRRTTGTTRGFIDA